MRNQPWNHLAAGFLGLVVALASSGVLAGEPVTFRNDVMAVLSRSGCNQGTCHGNKNGKGGFKLSLRGEDPLGDHAVLARDRFARFSSPMAPERSLLLRKPTMAVAHEGGRRFRAGDPEYEILRSWIAAGMPADGADVPRLAALEVEPHEVWFTEDETNVPLRVTAKFDDGGERDVTGLATYSVGRRTAEVSPGGVVQLPEPGEDVVLVRYLERQIAVRVARPHSREGSPRSLEPANEIDRLVLGKLRRLGIDPSPVCDDTTFLRRIHLDLLGGLPTVDEARRFLADTRPDKRQRLVDELLERPEYAAARALEWSDLLRSEEKTLDRKGVENFHAWIRLAVARNVPYDRFVRDLVTARGSTYEHPPANYYRAMRDPFVRAETTAQLFLGVRLRCAKCHNHPFDRWTQDDYYGWSNNFARIQYRVLANDRRDRNDKHEFDGEQIVYVARNGEVENPRIGRPTPPRLLGDAGSESDAGRLERVATWLTSPANDRFARVAVNRIWHRMLGRGIVDPIDDFRATNPPSNPELLDWLVRDFVDHGFDTKRVYRTIAASRVYQLDSIRNATNATDESNFSRAAVRRLRAEELLDALAVVTGSPVEFNGYPLGTRALEIPGVRAVRLRDESPSRGDAFLVRFGKPPRLEACECERRTEPTLNQTFELIGGPLLNDLLTRDEGRLSQWADESPEAAIDDLYWTALSRPPTAEERRGALAHVERTGDQRRAIEDLVWAVVNSHEFTFRR